MKDAPVGPVTDAYDLSMLARLRGVVADVSRALDEFDYASALRVAEAFFWSFCDDYVEMVKRRRLADDGSAASAIAASRLALSIQLRLFAPFLPFVTEEVWSTWQVGSVHRAPWPTVDEVDARASGSADGRLYTLTTGILAAVRAARSLKKIPFSTPVALTALHLTPEHRAQWSQVRTDVLACCNVTVADDTVVRDADGTELSADVEPVVGG